MRGLCIDLQAVNCRFSLRLAGGMGLLAFLDAPLPSDVRPRADRDNELNCGVRCGFVLQPFDTCASALGVEKALGVCLLVGRDDGHIHCDRACNYSDFLFCDVWARRRSLRSL